MSLRLRGAARPGAGRWAITSEEFRIKVASPFCAEALFEFFSRRAIAGVEAVGRTAAGELRYARTLRLPGGPAAIEVRWRAGTTVQVEVETGSDADAAAALRIAQALVDACAPAAEIDAALGGDPALAEQVARRPGVRLPGATDVHELLIRAIVGQQISVARARAHLSRLAGALGSPYSSRFTGLTALFPTASQLAQQLPVPKADAALEPTRVLRLPRRSIAAVVGASTAIASGSLHLPAGIDPDGAARELTALAGVGPWTASYVTMRLCPDPDAWLPGDVALVAGARTLGILDRSQHGRRAHQNLGDISERWRPWRSYAAMRLWLAAATNPDTPAK